jgi:urease accessory protein
MMVTESDYEIDHIEKSTSSHPDKYDDWVFLEWYEVRKSRHRTKTYKNKSIVIVRDSPVPIEETDILVCRNNYRIIVYVKPCECLVIEPNHLADAGLLAFMIGNFHVPIFSDNIAKIYFAYDSRLQRLLNKMGYTATIEEMKLLTVNQVSL